MSRKDALKLRGKIHELFHVWFTVKRKPYSDGYYLFNRLYSVPSGLLALVSDFGFSCFHFSDFETYIE